MKRGINSGMILFISVALLLFSGCGAFGGRGRNPEDTVAINTNFHVGTEGVFVRFVDEALPPVMYDRLGANRDEFVIQVELWNKGAYDTDVGLYLGGFDQNIIHLPTESAEDIHLMGRSLANSEGDKKDIQFPDVNGAYDGSVTIPQGSDSYRANMQATVCYEYSTEASPIVCLTPDPYKITSSQSCVPGTITGGNLGGQGAPVAVSSIIAQVIPGQVVFKILVSNANKGRVYAREEAQRGGKCPYDLTYLDMNYVDYEVTMQGRTVTSSIIPGSTEVIPNCQPARLRLANNQGTIFCRFPVDAVQKSTYETPIQIKLHYGYMDSINRVVEIKSIK
ncbi:hypothetical protein JXA85_03890 [Candidatus Woesearchaeota archaeon]|nr:hypothetical protein [Candidatus Woesearchaeota archaeon]